MGTLGTGGHTASGSGAGCLSVLLWMGLQQECDGGVRRAGNNRDGLRLLSLWDSHKSRRPYPARAVEQRDERRRFGAGLLLPLLQPG